MGRGRWPALLLFAAAGLVQPLLAAAKGSNSSHGLRVCPLNNTDEIEFADEGYIHEVEELSEEGVFVLHFDTVALPFSLCVVLLAVSFLRVGASLRRCDLKGQNEMKCGHYGCEMLQP